VSDRDATADWLLSAEGRLSRIVFETGLIPIGLALVGGLIGVLAERAPGQEARTRDPRAGD